MERFVKVPGGRIYAASEGAGPPIVLVHAAIADHRSWDSMVPGLVDAGHRVVRLDYRGYGESTTDDVEFSNRADIVAVLDSFRIGRAALVGNSRGGGIAMDTAIEFPDRVVAVVGVGASLSGYYEELTPAEMVLFGQAQSIMSAPEPDPDAITNLAITLWVDGPGQSAERVDPAIREAVRVMCRPLNEPGRVRGQSIPLEPAADERIGDLRCPVLAVAGELDVSSILGTARHLAQKAPNARAEIWPDVAHMIGMEVPDRLNELIIDFLAPLRPWS
jgi:pimeloyl-ACP methyl ester carboxylesterase